jgi:hypothetical protein
MILWFLTIKSPKLDPKKLNCTFCILFWQSHKKWSSYLKIKHFGPSIITFLAFWPQPFFFIQKEMTWHIFKLGGMKITKKLVCMSLMNFSVVSHFTSMTQLCQVGRKYSISINILDSPLPKNPCKKSNWNEHRTNQYLVKAPSKNSKSWSPPATNGNCRPNLLVLKFKSRQSTRFCRDAFLPVQAKT